MYDTDGKLVKQLTSGNWLVQNILGFDKDGKNLFFMSTEKSPMESHLYKVNLKSGKRTLITSQAGMHDVLLVLPERMLLISILRQTFLVLLILWIRIKGK